MLTSAQSLLATLLIAEFAFSRAEAVLLAALFGVQLLFPDTSVRCAFSGLYLAIFALAIVAVAAAARGVPRPAAPEPEARRAG